MAIEIVPPEDDMRVLKVVDNESGYGQRLYLNGVEIDDVLAYPRPYLLPAFESDSGEVVPDKYDLTLTIRVKLDPDTSPLRPLPMRQPYDDDHDSS